MLLSQALALPRDGGAVSLVGGGGKTSLMFLLARQLADAGARVVCTTTTHILPPSAGQADILLTDDFTRLPELLRPGTVVCMGASSSGEKLGAPPWQALEAAGRLTDWLIVEADGAHRLPVKAPAAWEPQLYQPSRVVAVAGLSALGKPLGEVCHRYELACALLNVPPNALLTPALLARLLTSTQGQYKHVGGGARFRVLLNQADDEALTALGGETAQQILRLLPGCRVAVAALRQTPYVKEVFSCSL